MVEAPQMQWSLPGKVVSYPTVVATVDTASSLYAATKSYGRLTQYAASIMERTAGTLAGSVYTVGKPLVTRFEPQLVAADKYASDKLKALEQRAPLMNERPEVIYEKTKEATLTSLNASYVGKAVSLALLPVISVAETLVPTGEESSKPEETEEAKKDESTCEVEEELNLQQTMGRVYHVGTRLQQRALDKAMEHVGTLTKRASTTLGSIAHTVDLIEYAKNLDEKTGVTTFLHDIWDDEGATVEKEEGEKRNEEAEVASKKAKIERRTLIVGRNLSRKLGLAVDNILNYSQPYVSEETFMRILNSKKAIKSLEITFQQATSFGQLSDVCISATKQNLHYLNQVLREFSSDAVNMVVSLRPIAWFVSAKVTGSTHGDEASEDSGSGCNSDGEQDEEGASGSGGVAMEGGHESEPETESHEDKHVHHHHEY